jgi:hypothetical protein
LYGSSIDFSFEKREERMKVNKKTAAPITAVIKFLFLNIFKIN